MYNDDDDPELQDAQKLESPGRAKLQALQQKLKQEGLSSTERMDLQELKKSMLKHQVEKKKGRKGKERTERRELGAFKTTTREEEIKRSRLTADINPMPDQLLQQGKQDRKAEEEMRKEEIQGEGG